MERIALVGNPNTGKTTYYNRLTHSNSHIGNWHGVTIEPEIRQAQRTPVEIVDLAGTYSLNPFSMEESITANFILKNATAVCNICEQKNLRRNLMLALQLIELNCELKLVVNTFGHAPTYDQNKLATALKCPVEFVDFFNKKQVDNTLNTAPRKPNNTAVTNYLSAFPINNIMQTLLKYDPNFENLPNINDKNINKCNIPKNTPTFSKGKNDLNATTTPHPNAIHTKVPHPNTICANNENSNSTKNENNAKNSINSKNNINVKNSNNNVEINTNTAQNNNNAPKNRNHTRIYLQLKQKLSAIFATPHSPQKPHNTPSNANPLCKKCAYKNTCTHKPTQFPQNSKEAVAKFVAIRLIEGNANYLNLYNLTDADKAHLNALATDANMQKIYASRFKQIDAILTSCQLHNAPNPPTNHTNKQSNKSSPASSEEQCENADKEVCENRVGYKYTKEQGRNTNKEKDENISNNERYERINNEKGENINKRKHAKHKAPQIGYETSPANHAKSPQKHAKNAFFSKFFAKNTTLQAKLDAILLNKYLAIPIFLLIILLVFYLTFGSLGAYLSNALDRLINALTAPWLNLVQTLNLPILYSLVSVGIIGGVGTVVTFLPQVLLLFLFLTILEESGYMARLAYLLEGLCNKVGLSGKSVFTFLMGFGCTATALMTAENLENKNAKLKTILCTPFMSCSAKLPVFAVLGGAFFGSGNVFLIFAMYAFSSLVGLAVVNLLDKTILPPKDNAFLLEFPPYRLPSLRVLSKSALKNTGQFLSRVGTYIFVFSLLIWFLQSFSTNLTFIGNTTATPAPPTTQGAISTTQGANANAEIATPTTQKSLLQSFAELIAPLFAPLGFGEWGAVSALLAGLVAKELIVSSVGIINNVGTGDVASLVGTSVLNSLNPVHFSIPSVLSFLTFCLLYTPCIATISAMRAEVGWKWTLLSVATQLLIAYASSFLLYTILGVVL